MAHRDRAAVHVHPVPVDPPGRPALPAPFPRGRAGQGLGREGLVDLDQVHVFHGQAPAFQEPGHGDGRRHEQALGRVVGGVGHAPDVRQRFQAARGGFLLAHQKHRGGAVGHRRRIARGERAVLRVEDGLQRGQRLERSIGPRTGIGFLAQQRVDLPGELFARGHGVAVAGQGHLVLPAARDVPRLAGQLHVLAHGQARGRLAEQVHGRPRQRIDPAGQPDVDTAAGNGVGHDRDRTQPGDAVGRHGMGLGADRQPRLEDELPGQVGLQGVGRHRAEDDGFDPFRVDPAPVQHAPRGVDGHGQGIDFGEGLARLDEGRPAAGDDGDALGAHGRCLS